MTRYHVEFDLPDATDPAFQIESHYRTFAENVKITELAEPHRFLVTMTPVNHNDGPPFGLRTTIDGAYRGAYNVIVEDAP